MRKPKRSTLKNKCRYCGEPVRISLESFVCDKDGHYHLECLKRAKLSVEREFADTRSTEPKRL